MSVFSRRASGFTILALIGLATFSYWVLRAPAPAAESPAFEKSKPLQLSDDEARRAGLQATKLEAAAAGEEIALFGTVETNKDRLARIVAPVAGRIAVMSAGLGDLVKKGDILAVLESPESGEAQAAYGQAEAELALAARNLDRIRGLVAGGSLARKEEAKAQAEHDKARAVLAAAKAKLTSFGLAPQGSTGRLAVTAPFDGAVIERAAVLGEHAQAHQALFTVADLTSLWIEAELFERDLARVAVGAAARVRVAAYPGRELTGTVKYVSSVLDRDTRTAKARIEIANADGALKPGMFATIGIALSGSKPVLRVPENALVLLQGQMTAFVRAGEGYEPRPVETGARQGGEIIVTSGLEAGDEVVTAGAYALKARLLKSQIGDAD